MESTQLVVIQATPFCNIDCKYCYLPNRHDKSKLPLNSLKTVFAKVFTFPTIHDSVTVVWHAGEPLALGVDYYEEAFQMIDALRPAKLKLKHAFQTNGTLLCERWCALAKKWDLSIGVSIDGPQELHDAQRVTRDNRGTFHRTLRGIKELQKSHIPFHVISVLTAKSLNRADDLFHFYRSEGITRVAFNIEEIEGSNKQSSLVQIDIDVFEQFFRRLIVLMAQEKFPIQVRELDQAFLAIRHMGQKYHFNEQVDPFGIISIDVRGNIYSFSPELVGHHHERYSNFSLGNIFSHGFDDFAKSLNFIRLREDIARGVDRCRDTCQYFDICGGGAPSNKLFENGTFDSTETMFCSLTKKAIIRVALEVIEANENSRRLAAGMDT